MKGTIKKLQDMATSISLQKEQFHRVAEELKGTEAVWNNTKYKGRRCVIDSVNYSYCRRDDGKSDITVTVKTYRKDENGFIQSWDHGRSSYRPIENFTIKGECNYYYLEEGDEIREGDEVFCDGPDWELTSVRIGERAPCPNYTSHRRYRRRCNGI